MRSMVGQLILISSLLGLHSAESLLDIKQINLSPICPGLRCPRGHSSHCPLEQNQTTRCLPCEEGTYSTHASSRKACKLCSRCRNNEFELWPCTRTSNVVCKECSQCPPGFEELVPCQRTRDTICRDKCRVTLQFEDVLGAGCRRGKPRNNGDHEMSANKKQGTELLGDSMPFIVVEVTSGPDVARKANQPDEPSSRTSGFQPTPGTPPSTFPNNSETMQPVPSGNYNSHTDVVAPEKAIDSSLSSTISTKSRFSLNPTTNSESENITKELSPREIRQGDGPNIQTPTPRRAEQNGTTKSIGSFSPTQSSSTLPPYRMRTKILFSQDSNADKEKSSKSSTAFPRGKKGNYDVELPNSEKKNKSESKFSNHMVLTASLCTGLLVAVILRGILRQHCQNPAENKGCIDFHSGFRQILRESRCTASSDCGTTPSSVPYGSSSDQIEECNVPRPVHASLQTLVTVDVHPSRFDVLPTITESCECPSSYPEFITSAQAIFDSSGGTLSHPDSNVSINVDSGAVPEGMHQRIFFQVAYDDTLLLRDIPKTSGSTLISPVVRCGPENINLLKPVEIVLPHCLCLDETKKDSVNVYKCERFSEQGPLSWQRVSSVSEKNNQSKAWFTVKMDTIHIKTRTFSFWSVFSCGGPKKKRATVFASKPNPLTDLLYLRFYIYSDNDDSKKRVERKDREQFPDSKRSKEKPFKVYNDGKDIQVWLNPEDLSNDGWEMDKTLHAQIYSCETAYKSGFRSKDSCDFAVKPMAARLDIAVKDFSCDLKFQQEDHRQHSIYVNPGFSPVPKQSVPPLSEETDNSSSSSSSNDGNQPLTPREIVNPDDKPSSAFSAKLPGQPCGRDDEPVTEEHCRCICGSIGTKWKRVLRNLPGIKEKHLENLEEDYRTCKVSEKCLQGLLEWRKIVGPRKATTRALYNSLQQEGCLDALEDLSKGGFGHDSQAAMLESIPE